MGGGHSKVSPVSYEEACKRGKMCSWIDVLLFLVCDLVAWLLFSGPESAAQNRGSFQTSCITQWLSASGHLCQGGDGGGSSREAFGGESHTVNWVEIRKVRLWSMLAMGVINYLCCTLNSVMLMRLSS